MRVDLGGSQRLERGEPEDDVRQALAWPRMALSLLATETSTQTCRSPLASASGSTATDPSGRVSAIASKAAEEIEMRIMDRI